MKKRVCSILAVILVIAMSVSAFAAATEYRPSVENKPAPEIVPKEVVIETEDGSETIEVIAEIIDENGEVIAYIEDGGIIVTPLSDDDASDELKEADKELKEKGFDDDIKEELTEIAKETGKGESYEDFVISDLFEVEITGDDEKYVADDGSLRDPETGAPVTIDITIDANLKDDDDTPVVAVKPGADQSWEIIPGENVTRNSDNSLTIKTGKVGVFALLPLTGNYIVSNPEQLSPQTGFDESVNEMNMPLVIGCAALAVAVIACSAAVVTKKVKEGKN